MKNILCILIAALTIVSCNRAKETAIEKFDESKPYAISIAKERSFYQAEKIKDRLIEMGVDAYISKATDSLNQEEGWYHVMTGGLINEDSASIQLNRIASMMEMDTSQFEIAEYNAGVVTSFNPDSIKRTESKRINANKPDIPEEVFDVISQFPESNALLVKKAFVFATPNIEGRQKDFSFLEDISLDLPRGIYRSHMLRNTSAFAEVIYEDNLYGDQLTIDIGKLYPHPGNISAASFITLENKQSFDIAEEYADKILETGDYLTETKEEIKISSTLTWYGYEVTIEPQYNYYRKYIILVDETNTYISFCQSTEKTTDELKNILSDIGKSDGLLYYDEFYNTFYTNPDDLAEDDIFLGYSLDKIGWDYVRHKGYADWSKECVGHWSAKSYFSSSKGMWTFGIFDLLTEDHQKYMNYLYRKVVQHPITEINGTSSVLVEDERYNWEVGRYVYFVSEINFGMNRYECMINNTQYSWLSKTDLIERIISMQLNETLLDPVEEVEETDEYIL